MSAPLILGINAYHGDSSAALLCGGEVLFAIEEERLNRVKHWAGFPEKACRACIEAAGGVRIEHVAIGRDTGANLLRKIGYVLRTPSAIRMALNRVGNAQRIRGIPEQLALLGLGDAKVHFVEHHRAHVASAFYASGFDEAVVVSLDGFGDFRSAMWGVGKGLDLEVRGGVFFPHSLGIFYSAFTQLLGFPNYGDEYKMMGLAAYGKPTYADRIRSIVHRNGDQIRLDLRWFVHHSSGAEMTWEGGSATVGAIYSPLLEREFGPVRKAGEALTEQHADIAASVQIVFEETYLGYLRHVAGATGLKKVCLAGGVALNCAANGKIFDQTPFRDVFIQPASHDAGISLGAALQVAHGVLRQPRTPPMRHVYLGSEYSDREIEAVLTEERISYRRFDDGPLLTETASAIADGNVVGWFQGRMEFGPRALGNRSILADPGSPQMQDILNERIKKRETFRPFCPSILAENTEEWFVTSYPSLFMVQAYEIRQEKRHLVPAVTHRDGTGRLQTVERDVNPRYWQLLKEFKGRTGLPILINTSFNENEPVVDTPRQAVNCFLRTRMDVLVIGNYIIRKIDNPGADGPG